MKRILSVSLMILAAGCAWAYAKDVKPATPPATLTATLIATKDTYTLDPAQAGKAFRDKLSKAEKDLQAVPAQPPKVDLILRLSNPTTEAVTIAVGGDESTIELQLEGPGAVTVNNMVAMTMEFRMGKPVTIAPGKTYDIAITSLFFGQRNIARCAFWTEEGEYTLAATLNTRQGDEVPLKVSSEPVKIKIVQENPKAGPKG